MNANASLFSLSSWRICWRKSTSWRSSFMERCSWRTSWSRSAGRSSVLVPSCKPGSDEPGCFKVYLLHRASNTKLEKIMKELDEEVRRYLFKALFLLLCLEFFIHVFSLSISVHPQCNARKSAEASVSLLEKDKLMLQHRTTEYQRKADQEGEKRRNLENEGLFILLFIYLLFIPHLLFHLLSSLLLLLHPVLLSFIHHSLSFSLFFCLNSFFLLSSSTLLLSSFLCFVISCFSSFSFFVLHSCFISGLWFVLSFFSPLFSFHLSPLFFLLS